MKKQSNINTGNHSIPLDIYQTWHTKKLPSGMQSNLDHLINRNPEFRYHLFDDRDCFDFIETHFDECVADAYEQLIPGAYKADLWRYCVLYVQGGIYLDIKYRCMGDFKLIQLADRECFGHDFSFPGVMNNFMVCRPKNEKMLQCINQIVLNVQKKHYGNNALEPTGPMLLGSHFTEEEKLLFNMYFHYENKGKIMEIRLYKDRNIFIGDAYRKNNINHDPDAFDVIFSMYPEYLIEKAKYQKTDYYAKLWKDKKIYLSDFSMSERIRHFFSGIGNKVREIF